MGVCFSEVEQFCRKLGLTLNVLSVEGHTINGRHPAEEDAAHFNIATTHLNIEVLKWLANLHSVLCNSKV